LINPPVFDDELRIDFRAKELSESLGGSERETAGSGHHLEEEASAI